MEAVGEPHCVDAGPQVPTVPHWATRIYPRFLPQLEKTHETFASLRDEARFPYIVSRAIAFSQSNNFKKKKIWGFWWKKSELIVFICN